ncbi:MAG: PAS domain-containing protein, partial [Firmicutes bacterium]|nr:PAS domain-containing protein [Bacillota bacterium]
MNNMPEEYRGLISFLGKALPEEYDTILFDLREKGYPVIEQGDWGSENVGDVRRCLTDLMKKGKARNNESIYNVIVPTRKSKLLKASFFFMKENGRPVSALALVTELDMFLRMNSFLTRRLTIMGPDGTE